MRGAAAIVASFVLLFVGGHRHRIDAGKPAVEIDVGAAPRAERTKRLDGWFAANRADAVRGLGHETNMGRRRTSGYTAFSQPKWIG